MKTNQDLKEAILEAAVEAAFQGHDMAPFQEVTDTVTGGFEARCRQCNQSVCVGDSGLMYSLLGEECSKARQR